jgi:hypothetical protein
MDFPPNVVPLFAFKEPLVPFEGGFGYQGILLMNEKDDTLQCHLCGEWVSFLAKHSLFAHGINAKDYRKKTGLLRGTALLNNASRIRMSESAKQRVAHSPLFPPLKGKTWTDEQRKRYEDGMTGRASMEAKNKHGTCPAQLLDRLRADAERLGRTPQAASCPYSRAIYRTYGTWGNALKLAGLEPNRVGKLPLQREDLLDALRRFKEREGRFPLASDFRRKELPTSIAPYYRLFGSLEAAKQLVV